MLKVCKFGGTSMADAGQLQKAGNIVRMDPDRRVVVVSAAGKRSKEDHKLTDLLYLCYAHLQYHVSCAEIFAEIRTRCLQIRDELGLSTELEPEFDRLWAQMEQGISQDALVSRGEYFSARLFADYLGYTFVDACDWLHFRFDGSVDQEQSYSALRALADGRRVVTPGFYGVMPDGAIKTFSRGGSDITGALAAAALDADLYENWTDVPGILMADPRIIDHPRTITHITYSELRELSYIGAQVLHEMTIFPVREKNIPLNIRNTNDPAHPGTLIKESFNDPPQGDQGFITGIAGRKNFTVVTISKTGMSSQIGVMRRVLEIFEKHHISVEYAPNGIDSISLVVSADKLDGCLYSILSQLQQQLAPDHIQVTENIAIVAAVGRKMAFHAGVSGKIFAKLGENGINIRMISQGPEELNIIVGVDEKDFVKAIGVLYHSFVN